MVQSHPPQKGLPQKSLPQKSLIGRLKGAGLRPTRQRLALAKLLFAEGDRHVSAEQLYTEAMNAKVSVSLATVYNTLHQFQTAGLLREVLVGSGRSYFDTNSGEHCHFYDAVAGRLVDIPREAIAFSRLPEPPRGKRILRVDVVVHLAQDN